jgi:DNA-directed RNA polymerase specialized sigma24 family protein
MIERPTRHRHSRIDLRPELNKGESPEDLCEQWSLHYLADSEILRKPLEWQERDYATAFQAGYHRTFLALLRRCRRYDLAEDVAMSAWLRAWERWGQCRSDDAVPWVMGIARYMLSDEIKRSSRYRGLEPEQ